MRELRPASPAYAKGKCAIIDVAHNAPPIVQADTWPAVLAKLKEQP